MDEKIINICGKERTLSLLRYILEQYEKDVPIRQYDSDSKLQEDLRSLSGILILDDDVVKKPILKFMDELHEKTPLLKTILIVAPTKKDEVLSIIRASLVRGLIVKPFSGELICKNVERLL